MREHSEIQTSFSQSQWVGWSCLVEVRIDSNTFSTKLTALGYFHKGWGQPLDHPHPIEAESLFHLLPFEPIRDRITDKARPTNWNHLNFFIALIASHGYHPSSSLHHFLLSILGASNQSF